VLVGSGATVYGTWFIGTVLGYAAAAGVPLSATPWVSFLVPAVLLAVLAGFWSGVRSSLAPWLVAGAIAVASAHLLPGNWYVLLGGGAGMIVGALSDGR
jgi:predicted branched-subunit amino acid permease